MNPFNLERARAGEPIQTVEGRERRFIAYLPDRRPHLRVVVLDPKSDRIYSHSESGEHCESVESLRLIMKPVQEPAPAISPEIREELLRIVREVFPPTTKVVRWLAVWWTPSGFVCSNALYVHESDALARAKLAVEAYASHKDPRAVRIEL